MKCAIPRVSIKRRVSPTHGTNRSFFRMHSVEYTIQTLIERNNWKFCTCQNYFYQVIKFIALIFELKLLFHRWGSRKLELHQRFGGIREVWHSFPHFSVSFFSIFSHSSPGTLKIKFPWILRLMTSGSVLPKRGTSRRLESWRKREILLFFF